MESRYNMRSPAVKRLMKEAQELRLPTEEFFAQPLEDNLFEWHFTVRGPPDSDFDNGIYHGRIILPAEYPMKPPSIILLTPNGRFEVNKKICLSISGHHPESWQPSWSIRTALLAIIGFMPSSGNGAIGSLDYTSEERRALARKSHEWKCYVCGPIKDLLLKRTNNSVTTSAEAMELASQISFKSEGDHSLQNNLTGEMLLTKDNNTTLPFSRLLSGSAPIALPEHANVVTDVANIPVGVGMDETHSRDSSTTATIVRHRALESSDFKTPIREPPVEGEGAVVHRDLFYSIAIVVICVAMAFLVFRRLFFIL